MTRAITACLFFMNTKLCREKRLIICLHKEYSSLIDKEEKNGFVESLRKNTRRFYKFLKQSPACFEVVGEQRRAAPTENEQGYL